MDRRSVNFRNIVPALLLILAACSDDEVVLEGPREPVRIASSALTGALENDAPSVGFAAPSLNDNWPHQNGSPTQAAAHIDANFPLTQVWGANLGQGGSRAAQITASAIVADGRVFAMDATGVVSAFDLDGTLAWRRDLAPSDEGRADGFGGGLTYGNDTLIATSGFAKAVAIEPDSGDIRWEQALDAPARAPGVVSGGRVFVVARDNQAYAIDLKNGRIRWRLEGIETETGMLGGAAPAVSNGVVVIPFGSGEVVGALVRNGRRVWTSSLSGGRRGTVRSRIDDITGDPVISGNAVYVANQSGRFVSLDRSSGARNWSLNEGTMGPALPIGNSVFLVNDLGQLKRVDRRSGDAIWSVQLPQFSNEKRAEVFAYSGPLLVGGRLLIGAPGAGLLSFDPASGVSLGPVGGPETGFVGQPAVAQGMMFFVTPGGQLVAFR